MIPLLAPLFPGEWAHYAETLACAPAYPPDATPVAKLIDDENLLTGTLHRHALLLGVAGGDLRAVASAWSMAYVAALLPPVAAAASVLQHGLPMRAHDVAVSLDESGMPLRFHITGEGAPMRGQAVAARYNPLLSQHLEPLFAALCRQTRVPMKILWGNAARHLEAVLDQALLLTGAAHVAADREALLQQPRHPDGTVNPLYARQNEILRSEGGQPVPFKLHRRCCLYYRLPGYDYCGACPLAPAMLARRRGR